MTAMPAGVTLFVPASSGGGGSGGMTPTFLDVAEVFAVPDNRQAPMRVPIYLSAGASVTVGANAVLYEVPGP